MSRRLAALVLAAGASSRLGHPKQLVVFQGERLLDRAIRIAHQTGASPVFVVIGAEYEQMLPLVLNNVYKPRILINKAWNRGMATSLELGAAAAERAGAKDLLVLACDQPAVTSEHLRQLVEVSEREHVVASYYQSRRGIPALFPSFAFRALQDLQGDTGARDLLQNESVLTVALAGGEFDVDTHEDVLRLHAMDRRGGPFGDQPIFD